MVFCIYTTRGVHLSHRVNFVFRVSLKSAFCPYLFLHICKSILKAGQNQIRLQGRKFVLLYSYFGEVLILHTQKVITLN